MATMIVRRRRGIALYVSVLATAIIVSALALAAIAVVRVERKQARALGDRLTARTHARSAAELALVQLNNDLSWRTTFANNVETAPVSLGANSEGTLSWKLLDVDGSLTNADQKLWLKGIGRVGEAVQVSSLQLAPNQVGPTTLRSYTSVLSASNGDVKHDSWWGQYFRPTLPAEATGWRVTSAQLYCRREQDGHAVNIRIYKSSLAADNLIETVSLSSNSFPSNSGSYFWYTISFSRAYWLNATDAAYMTVETASNQSPIRLQYRSGVSQPDSAMVRGTPAWGSHETDKVLLYRINGHYSTSSGVTPVAASWIWDSL